MPLYGYKPDNLRYRFVVSFAAGANNAMFYGRLAVGAALACAFILGNLHSVIHLLVLLVIALLMLTGLVMTTSHTHGAGGLRVGPHWAGKVSAQITEKMHRYMRTTRHSAVALNTPGIIENGCAAVLAVLCFAAWRFEQPFGYMATTLLLLYAASTVAQTVVYPGWYNVEKEPDKMWRRAQWWHPPLVATLAACVLLAFGPYRTDELAYALAICLLNIPTLYGLVVNRALNIVQSEVDALTDQQDVNLSQTVHAGIKSQVLTLASLIRQLPTEMLESLTGLRMLSNLGHLETETYYLVYSKFSGYVDWWDLAARALKDSSQLAGKTLTVAPAAQDTIDLVGVAHRRSLRNWMLDLTNNSIRHGGTAIVVSLTVKPLSSYQVSVVLQVTDNGSGFDFQRLSTDSSKSLYMLRRDIESKTGTLTYKLLSQGSCMEVEWKFGIPQQREEANK